MVGGSELMHLWPHHFKQMSDSLTEGGEHARVSRRGLRSNGKVHCGYIPEVGVSKSLNFLV